MANETLLVFAPDYNMYKLFLSEYSNFIALHKPKYISNLDRVRGFEQGTKVALVNLWQLDLTPSELEYIKGKFNVAEVIL